MKIIPGGSGQVGRASPWFGLHKLARQIEIGTPLKRPEQNRAGWHFSFPDWPAAALDLCLVADGTYDGYWEKKLQPWDCAGGAAIVLAAGGHLSDYAGGPPDLLNGQLLATNGAIHAALIAELQTVPSSSIPPTRFRR